VQNAGGIGKGHQTNSGFSAQRTTRSATGRIRESRSFVPLLSIGDKFRIRSRQACLQMRLQLA